MAGRVRGEGLKGEVALRYGRGLNVTLGLAVSEDRCFSNYRLLGDSNRYWIRPLSLLFCCRPERSVVYIRQHRRRVTTILRFDISFIL